jgi:hypothetical protein
MGISISKPMMSGNTKIKGCGRGRPLVACPVKGRDREAYNEYMKRYMHERRKATSEVVPREIKQADRSRALYDPMRDGALSPPRDLTGIVMNDPSPDRRARAL